MTKKDHTLFDVCCIFGLLIVLVFPMLGMFMEPDAKRFKRIERRQPAPAPAISFRFDKESESLEKWFNDRVAFRFELIKVMTRLYLALGVSATPDRVTIGKDDWLFLGNQSSKVLTQHRRLDWEDRARVDVSKAITFFVTLRNALADRNIPFMLLIAPDKHSIYPEKLPDWAQRRVRTPSRLNLIRKGLMQQQVVVIDPTEQLLQKKSNPQALYFPGGTHWNSVGGFYAFQEAADYLRTLLNIPETILNDKIKYYETPGDNTLYNWLEYPSTYYIKDNQPWFNSVSRKQWLKKYWGQEDPEDVRITRKLRVPYGTAPQRIVNTALDSESRLLLIRDSFGNFMAPYLHCIIKEVIHIRYSELSKSPVMDLVDTYQPDVLIYEIGEKFLRRRMPLTEIDRDLSRARLAKAQP